MNDKFKIRRNKYNLNFLLLIREQKALLAYWQADNDIIKLEALHVIIFLLDWSIHEFYL